MKVVLGYTAVPTVDATSVRLKSSTADPVPTCTLSVRDDTSSIAVQEMMELWVIDEQKLANPAWNLLQGPSLKSTDTSRWVNTSSGGYTGTISFAGAPPVTATTTDTTGGGFVLNFQNVQQGLVVPGVQYMLSCYITIATPMSNAQSILKFGWLDAGLNYLGDVATDYRSTTAGNAQQRISISATAPAGVAAAQISFGIKTVANGAASGTALFATIQFEPMWWSNEMAYPTPDCNPAQTTCVVLPNNTTIRQYRKFGGWVSRFIAQDYHGNARTWHIEAVGYSMLMSQTYTISAFVAQFDSAIISSLISTYYQGNAGFPGTNLFSTTNVVQGVQIANLQPNWDNLRTIFDDLAANAGFFWTVDPYFNLYYEPPGYTQMPIALICDSSATPDMVTTFPGYHVQAETDFTQPGCSVLVIGGNVSLSLMAALTSGVPVTSLTVSPVPVYIASGTVLSMGGNQGITLSSAASVNDTTLHINSFNPNTSYGVGTNIFSNPYVGSVFDPAQSSIYNQSLYGFGVPNNFFIRKINDAALESVSDVINRGIAEIIQYDQARKIYHVSTNVELLVGQSIQVTDAQNGFNAASLLIQQVTAQWLGMDETLHDVWEYQADLGSVNRAASSILSHLYRITQANTSAPAVNQTALVVLEKFNYSDVPQYPYPLTVLADTPNAYYRLGEATGSQAFDSSGNAFIGTYSVSGVTYAVTGAIKNDPNTAVTLDGAAGEITLPSGATPTGWGAITLEAWFNLSTTSFGTFPRIFSCDSTVSDNKGCELLILSNASGLFFSIGNGTTHVAVQANIQLQAGVWYHFVGAWSNSDTNAYIYLNGVQQATGTLSGTIAAPTNTMAIGFSPVTSSNYFPGTLDEATEYQGRLSAARVLTHYNVGITGHS